MHFLSWKFGGNSYSEFQDEFQLPQIYLEMGEHFPPPFYSAPEVGRVIFLPVFTPTSAFQSPKRIKYFTAKKNGDNGGCGVDDKLEVF